MIKKILTFIFSLALFGAFTIPAFAANTTVTVMNGDLDPNGPSPAAVRADGLNKWFLYNDTNDTVDNTLGSFVVGPGTPINGVGSVEFTLGANPNDRKNIATYQFAGTPLSSISKLSFGTYSHSGVGSATEAPFLNFNVDFTGTGTSFQRRLVFVPSVNGSVIKDVWQTWDAYNAGNALWSYSGSVWPTATAGPDNGVIGTPGTTAKTWNTILADYPGIRVLPTDSWLGIRVGEPGPSGYTGNVDFFSIKTGNNETLFDFEPTVGPPVHKDECKNDGWKTFNNPSFKNQEKCIDYVEKHSQDIKGDVKYDAYGLKRHAEFEMNTGDNKGSFEYEDADKNHYKVKVSSVSANGNFGYFAGVVTKASNPAWVGLWLFAKVEDNSPDKIWGSFTNQTTAQNGVTNQTSPADGPFNVSSGKIKIH